MPNPFQLDNLQFWLLNAPFFALLLLLSICSFSLIVEKLLLRRRWRCRDKQLPAKASRYLKSCKLQQLSQLLEGEGGPEARLLRKSFYFIKHELENPNLDGADDDPEQGQLAELALLQNIQDTQDSQPTDYQTDRQSHYSSQIARLEHWIETCIEELGLQMEQHCNLFHLIANLATLLGLLGTVTGMIYAFQNGALEQSSQLAQGISQALVTTAGGLIVAIPAIVSQQLFLNASSLRIARLEQLGHDILSFQHKRLSLQSNLQPSQRLSQGQQNQTQAQLQEQAQAEAQAQFQPQSQPTQSQTQTTVVSQATQSFSSISASPIAQSRQTSHQESYQNHQEYHGQQAHNDKDLAKLHRTALMQRSEQIARQAAEQITGSQAPASRKVNAFSPSGQTAHHAAPSDAAAPSQHSRQKAESDQAAGSTAREESAAQAAPRPSPKPPTESSQSSGPKETAPEGEKPAESSRALFAERIAKLQRERTEKRQEEANPARQTQNADREPSPTEPSQAESPSKAAQPPTVPPEAEGALLLRNLERELANAPKAAAKSEPRHKGKQNNRDGKTHAAH